MLLFHKDKTNQKEKETIIKTDTWLKDCNSCIVHFDDKHYSRARVIHGKSNLIDLFFEDTDLRDMRYSKIAVDFSDNILGYVQTLCNVVVKKNPNYPDRPEFWMGECEILIINKAVQRQQDIRADINLQVRFFSETRRPFYAVITNLSAGGIFITTSEPLRIGEELSFKYNFRSLERIFRAEVLRVTKMPDNRFGYGLRFLDLTDGAESAIRSYVFKALRKEEQAKEVNQ